MLFFGSVAKKGRGERNTSKLHSKREKSKFYNLWVISLGKNRDSVTIIGTILEIAVPAGATKTKIMFRAGLSSSLLNKYLDIILDAGFIRIENYRYYLTLRGREFLKRYRLFEERYIRAQKLLEALDCEHERLVRCYEKDRSCLNLTG
jgi:predicted transcriptional regulator